MVSAHIIEWIEIKYNIVIGIVNQLRTISAIVLGLAFQELAQQFYLRGYKSEISGANFVIAISIGFFLIIVSAVTEGLISARKRRELDSYQCAVQAGYFAQDTPYDPRRR